MLAIQDWLHHKMDHDVQALQLRTRQSSPVAPYQYGQNCIMSPLGRRTDHKFTDTKKSLGGWSAGIPKLWTSWNAEWPTEVIYFLDQQLGLVVRLDKKKMAQTLLHFQHTKLFASAVWFQSEFPNHPSNCWCFPPFA